ncbi:MAG: radical SAM family heme chaperone HemW [Bacteroidota bacterium]
MAGIYIHIPFCKQACHYCNFHFSLSLSRKNELIEAILFEIENRKTYLEGEVIRTIYIGGGTPSILEYEDLAKILDKIQRIYPKLEIEEFTLEANPDDLDTSKIKDFIKLGINRLSIGIQSFHDIDLKYMNRVHNSEEALSSIYRSQDAGIENISIDLIYGTPTMNHEQWRENLQTAFQSQITHLSAYALTVEPKTKLASLIKKKIIQTPVDEVAYIQFQKMLEMMEQNSFEAYEISNFCKGEHYSKHNTSYWKGIPYIGFGPSAHSYNGVSRQWNISNNFKYMRDVKTAGGYYELETLSTNNQVNEYIMTSLRTKWGMDLNYIEQKFGSSIKENISSTLDKDISKEYYQIVDGVIYLSRAGKFMADGIASNLFMD